MGLMDWTTRKVIQNTIASINKYTGEDNNNVEGAMLWVKTRSKSVVILGLLDHLNKRPMMTNSGKGVTVVDVISSALQVELVPDNEKKAEKIWRLIDEEIKDKML